LVKVSRKSVQPFPRTVVWHFCGEQKKAKKNKKQKKTKKICKTYTHPPHRRLRKIAAAAAAGGRPYRGVLRHRCVAASAVCISLTGARERTDGQQTE